MGSPISLGQVSEHQYEDKTDEEILNDITFEYIEIGTIPSKNLTREELMLVDAHLAAVCAILEGKQ
jgi:hypothetical protein